MGWVRTRLTQRWVADRISDPAGTPGAQAQSQSWTAGAGPVASMVGRSSAQAQSQSYCPRWREGKLGESTSDTPDLSCTSILPPGDNHKASPLLRGKRRTTSQDHPCGLTKSQELVRDRSECDRSHLILYYFIVTAQLRLSNPLRGGSWGVIRSPPRSTPEGCSPGGRGKDRQGNEWCAKPGGVPRPTGGFPPWLGS